MGFVISRRGLQIQILTQLPVQVISFVNCLFDLFGIPTRFGTGII